MRRTSSMTDAKDFKASLPVVFREPNIGELHRPGWSAGCGARKAELVGGPPEFVEDCAYPQCG